MDEIQKYSPNLSAIQMNQLAALGPLYDDWNSKINVISRKDIDNLYSHHVLHSMTIARYIQFKPGTKILDVGTGGGFPGLPLAILFPECQFTLVDSVGKKLKVVDVIASNIGLSNVKTIHGRAEDVPGKYDFVVSRAVCRLDIMWSWVANKIASDGPNELANGLLYLKGGDIDPEKPRAVKVTYWPLNEQFSGEFFSNKGLVYIHKVDK